MGSVHIKESRQLVLPLQTVLDAIVHFDFMTTQYLSRGEIVQAEFVPGSSLQSGLDVAVMSAEERVIEWRHFSLTDISTAIVNFCRSKRIPLPFSGTKSLSITAEGAAFQIENTVDLAPPAKPESDLSGRPLRYAKGYEPHALRPSSKTESLV